MYEAVSRRGGLVPSAIAAAAALSADECEIVKLRVRDRFVEELLVQYASRSSSLGSEGERNPAPLPGGVRHVKNQVEEREYSETPQ